MLSFPTVHTVTGALLDAEAAAARAGWHRPPTLLAVRRQPTDPTEPDPPRLLATPVPVPAEQWFDHAAGHLGVLADVAAVLRTPVVRAVFARARVAAPHARTVAWALVYQT